MTNKTKELINTTGIMTFGFIFTLAILGLPLLAISRNSTIIELITCGLAFTYLSMMYKAVPTKTILISAISYGLILFATIALILG